MHGNFKQSPSAGSIFRNVHQPDFTLFGERALANSTRPSSGFNSEGFLYAPGYTPYAKSPYTGNTSPTSFVSFMTGDKSPTQAHFGTYYMPANSPADFENEGFDYDHTSPAYLPRSRSLLDQERPVSGRIKRQLSEQTCLTRGRPLSRQSEFERQFDYNRAQSSLSECM